MGDDSFEGSPVFLAMHFELLEDIDAPIPIFAKDVFVGDEKAAPLLYTVAKEAIITSKHKETCENNGEPCDDGNACTTEETCVAKVCAAENLLCDDGEVCTFDFCDTTLGCFHQIAVNDCPCHDGDICTSSGSCQEGVCAVEKTVGCE